MAFSRSENKGVFSTEVTRVIRATCVGPTHRLLRLARLHGCYPRPVNAHATTKRGRDGSPRPNRFPAGNGDGYTRGKARRAGDAADVPPAPWKTHCAARRWDVPAPKTTNLGRKKRKRRQRCKERYAKAREDAQLIGIIPTVPEGAVRNEVAPVAPDPPLPQLIRQALRENWATPDASKSKVVADLLAAFFEEGADPMLRIRLFRTLLLADQTQYARDHPEQARKGSRGQRGPVGNSTRCP